MCCSQEFEAQQGQEKKGTIINTLLIQPYQDSWRYLILWHHRITILNGNLPL